MSATFSLFPPPPDLADSIQAVWLAQGRTAHRREVVLPNGAVELIVNLSDPQWVVESALHPRRRYDHVFLAGTQRGPLAIEDEAETDLLGVRFLPGGVTGWLTVPLGALTDRIEDAADLELRWAKTLRERVGAQTDALARACAAFTVLREHRRRPPDGQRVAAVIAALMQDQHPPPIRALAARIGVTHKHLDTLFHRAVGVSPQKLRRILRFHDVVSWLQRNRRPVDWASLALASGFSDQAHLIREFRALSGKTPSQFLRLRTDDGWHLKADAEIRQPDQPLPTDR